MWQALIRIFRRPAEQPPSLEQRIAHAADDRELMRLAAEALRARQPQHAHVAYWKAVQYCLSQQYHLKTLGILNTILRFSPNDGNAHLVRIQTLEHVGRWRDAAGACSQAAQLFWAHGDRERASWLLARSRELDPEVVPVAPESTIPPPMVIVGTPLPQTSSHTGVIELDIEPPSGMLPNVEEAGTVLMDAFEEPRTILADALADSRTCVSFDSMPSAMIGTEHEAIARGYFASTIPESATRTYDQSELAALLDESSAA